MGNILGSTSVPEAAEPAAEPAEGEAPAADTGGSTPLLTEEDTQWEEESGVVLPVRASLPPPRFGQHITVLSIDGGGIRGLIPAVVLKRLEEKLQLAEKELNGEENVQIADYFDVVAGTSTGALITAMLVTPGQNNRPKYTPQEIQQFYVDNGSKIFPRKRRWMVMEDRWSMSIRIPRIFLGPKYVGTFLQDKIELQLGKITLDKTLCKIVVPTFDVSRMEPVIFTSYKERQIPEVKPRLSDICIGTTAAPTFFPAHHFVLTNGDKDTDFHLIDGGVAANNPTMSAISKVTTEQLSKNPDFRDDGVDYSRYLVISIGTGSLVNEEGFYTAKRCARWGPIGWIRDWRNGHQPIIDIFSNASAMLVNWQVAMLLHNGNYLRIQAQLTEDMPMDNATLGNIQTLVDVGNGLMGKKVHRLDLSTGRYQVDANARTNDQELTRLAQLLVIERARRFAKRAKAEAEAEGAEPAAEPAEAEAPAADAAAEAEAAESAAEPAEAEAPAADAAAEAEAAEPVWCVE